MRNVRVLVAVPLLLSALRAQDPPERVEVRYRNLEEWKESNGTHVVYLSGSVEIKTSKLIVRCDRLLGWVPPGEKQKFAFSQVYAEGNITLIGADSFVEAERLFVDLPTERALILSMTLRSFSPELQVPVVVRAEEARQVASNRFVLENATATTCTFGTPHYFVRIKHAELNIERQETRKVGDLEVPWGATHFDAKNLSLWYEGIPLFYLPGASYTPGDEFFLRKLRFGNSSRFGPYALSEWGVSIRKDKRKWGDLIVQADYRTQRGWAGGLDADYRWDGYAGYVDTYALHDLGPNPDVGFDERFIPLERKDRWRVRTFHRQAITDELRAELETSSLSDRNLLEEFFPDEFKNGKEQETVGYLRYLNGSLGAFAIERHRTNDFQTQIEYMPRLGLWWLSQPLSILRYSQVTDAANQRQMFDTTLPTRPFRTARFDTAHELFAPIDLGPIQADPFTLGRFTAYERDLNDDPRYRIAGTSGARLRSTISGVHPVESLGMHGLRHIVDLSAQYATTFASSVEAEDLFQMDPVDGIDEFQEFAFEVRQRFQTKRPDQKLQEFLNVGVQWEYYPDGHRDTGFVNPNNSLYPFNWISVFRVPDHDFETRSWSNIYWDLRFQPEGVLSLAAKGEWNPVDKMEEAREVVLTGRPAAPLVVTASHYYLVHVTDAYAFSASIELNEKWKVGGAVQYDFHEDEFLTQRIEVERRFHDYALQFAFEHEQTRGDIRVFVSVIPGPRRPPK